MSMASPNGYFHRAEMAWQIAGLARGASGCLAVGLPAAKCRYPGKPARRGLTDPPGPRPAVVQSIGLGLSGPGEIARQRPP